MSYLERVTRRLPQRLGDAARFTIWAYTPFKSIAARELYSLLATRAFTENGLYLNLGYWKTARTIDEACAALAMLVAEAAGTRSRKRKDRWRRCKRCRSMAVVGMAANPTGAHQAGRHRARCCLACRIRRRRGCEAGWRTPSWWRLRHGTRYITPTDSVAAGSGDCWMPSGRRLPYRRNVLTLNAMAKHRSRALSRDRVIRGHGLACGLTADAWMRDDDARVPPETHAARCTGGRA